MLPSVSPFTTFQVHKSKFAFCYKKEPAFHETKNVECTNND